ncbi:MAG: GHKL domain-containing protein [Chlamydiae bacterium]|nr:GHKL domain-containing protein [Chlamydiota bacterium]MBI3277098.1 GHKL domain-containing protein [Chlamydiota bacterium]
MNVIIQIFFSIVLALITFFWLRDARRIQKLHSLLDRAEMGLEKKRELQSIEQAKLDAVLSSMFEGILLTDDRGQILLMNPSLRKSFFIHFPPEGKRPIEVIRNVTIQNMVDQALQTPGKLISEEISLTLPEEKFLRVNAVSIVRENSVEGAILIFHDITELRRLEKVRQDFVANVSHELRTPVCSIKGYAETLLDGALEDSNSSRKFVDIIYRDSTRLETLINDLLDLARIESGKMKMVLLPIHVSDVIEKTMAIIENQAKIKSIEMIVKTQSSLPKILADETRLSQVMLNLLDNAIKYTPKSGVIHVEAARQDSFVQVDVSDTGIGISSKDLSRVFERFYRADKARSKELGGTGLGLSIVKHIVQAHGGEVWARSQMGQGSIFSFRIPCE